MEKWPNFFIVGSPKSGTTSLYEYLNQTKGVYMSPVKEPRFFNHNIPESYLHRILEKKEYLKLFKNVKDEKAIGEASPTYLWDPESPKLIFEAVPNASIIIILRGPVNRAFSHYLYLKSQGLEDRSFSQIIKQRLHRKTDYDTCLDLGMYYESVKRYLEIFGKNQVKIIIFEEFTNDALNITKGVLKFLRINEEPPKSVGSAHNVYGVPRGKVGRFVLRSKNISNIASTVLPQSLKWKLKEKVILKHDDKPIMDIKDRKILQGFYEDDAKKLEKLLKRNLPWLYNLS